MFKSFTNISFTTYSFESFILNLFMALLCGYLVSLFYRWSYRGPNYTVSFVQAIVVLSMVTALVIMVIGNNLARAFGLVGAMSIIRFRTAVKDTHDIVFIFFALAVGMAAGVGLRLHALFGSIFIGSILMMLHRMNYAKIHKKEFLLQFQCFMRTDESPYLDILERHCKRFKLVNMQSTGEEDMYELSFYVELKDRSGHPALLNELNRLREIDSVRFYFDEDQS
jgi:uncharacterized membrane protein YhiD involved in acid resistance